MSPPDNYTYYRQRAAQERQNAKNSASPALAHLHEQLAEAYEAFVAEIEAKPPLKLVKPEAIKGPTPQDPHSEREASATG